MSQVQALVEKAVADGVFPGAVYMAWAPGKAGVSGQAGRMTYCSDSPAMSADLIFDLASVSKVIGTTSAAMLLFAEGKFDLETPVSKVVPEFGANGKEKLTFGNLLRHDGGLIAFRPYHKTCTEPGEVLQAIYQEKLQYEPGTKMVYSDLSMIILSEAIYRFTGQTLDAFLAKKVFAPLGMMDTGYFLYGRPGGTFLNPQEVDIRPKVVPTERVEDWRRALWKKRGLTPDKFRSDSAEYIQAEVHDPTATVLGGVAGHAGLFSTVGDLATFLKNFIDPEPKLFKREVVHLFTRKQSDLSSRGLGWDTKSPTGSSAGSIFGPRSFGHTGYTGTSVWVDPDSEMVSILLSNRVHPSSENTKILAFRPVFHDAVARDLGLN